MKKTLLSLAFATAALFAANTVSAQTNNNAPCNQTCAPAQCNTACATPCNNNCNNNCPAEGKRKHKTDSCRQACMFEGINLTPDQLTALKAIPSPRDVMKAARQQAKTDTVKVDRKQLRELVRTTRMDYLKSIKNVLTPEQYSQFLENYFVNNAGSKHKGKFDGDRKNGQFKKGDRKGCKNGKNEARKDRKDRRGDKDKAQNQRRQNRNQG